MCSRFSFRLVKARKMECDYEYEYEYVSHILALNINPDPYTPP